MDSFPFYDLFSTKMDIKKSLNELVKEDQKKEPKDHFFRILINRESDLPLYKITDYFSERCRIKCSFSKKDSPIVIFKKRLSHFEKIEFKDYFDFDLYFRSTVLNCSNFPLPVAVEVYKYFKPTRILDFSAGWGDRLIAAIAYSKTTNRKIEYHGIDPSKCMSKIYKKIVSFFDVDPSKFFVRKKPFEDYSPKKEYYDLVFTSPPFFNYEVYEKDNPHQSSEKWRNGNEWKENFLFPALLKSYQSLKEEGILALYVADIKWFSYVKDMKTESIKIGFKFLGTIDWVNLERKGKLKTRKIYVFKK